MNNSFISSPSTRRMHYNPSSSSSQPAITSTYNRRINKHNNSKRLDRDLYTQHLLLGQDAYWLDSGDAPESQFNTPMDAVEYQSPLASANAFDDAHALNDLEIEERVAATQVASGVVATAPSAAASPNPFLDDTAAGRWPSTPPRPMRTSPTTHRLSLSNRHHQHDSESSSSSLIIMDTRPTMLDDDSRITSSTTIASTSTARRSPPLPRTTRRSRMTTSNSITYDLPPRSLDAAPPVIVNKRLTHPPLTPTSPPASSASSSSASSAALSSPSSNTIDTSSSTTVNGVRRRPSPFPLGPVQAPTPPPRRRNRYVPPSPHIVDIAVETFNLPTTTLSTTHRRSIDSEASRASPVQRASTLIDEDEDDTTTAHATNARNSPVRQHMQQGHLDKSVIHSSLEEERERQWRRLDEERARSMEITWDASAVTNEKTEHPCKWTAKKEKKEKEVKEEKKTEKKKKTSWWRSCFGGGRAIVHDEEVVPTPQPLEVEEDDFMFAEAFRDEEEDQEEVQEDEKRAMRAKRRKTLKKRV